MEYDELEKVNKEPPSDMSLKRSGSTFLDANGQYISDAFASKDLNRVCAGCHEKFEEYFDNEEDEWRFKDGVIKGNMAIHRYCVELVENNGSSSFDAMVKQEPS